MPFGKVIYGDVALQSIYKEYGDDVSQGKIWQKGYEYLDDEFPNLSYIDYCRVLTDKEIEYYLIKEDLQHDLLGQIYDFEEEQGFNTATFVCALIVAVGCTAGFAYWIWNQFKKAPVKHH